MTTDRFVQLELRVLREKRWPDKAKSEADLFREWGLAAHPQEVIWVVAYDAMKNLRTVTEVARGGHQECDLHIPTAMAAVLTCGAERFALVHNHPSNDARPSPADGDVTAKILAAANACGLYMEDHLIVTPSGRHFSFADAGLLIPAPYPGSSEALA